MNSQPVITFDASLGGWVREFWTRASLMPQILSDSFGRPLVFPTREAATSASL